MKTMTGKIIASLSLLASFHTAFATEHVVTQKDKKFSVAKLSNVKMGDTIVFKNAETDITHNIYSITPGNEFDLQTQKPGEVTKLDTSKQKAGKMMVECAIHPTMKLEVDIAP